MSQTAVSGGGPAPSAEASRSRAAPRPARARRLDLYRAKGIAILLVVLGHIVAREQPPGVEWYEPFRYAIYRFHMPFFLYLSGTVVVLTGVHRAAPADWPKTVMRLGSPPKSLIFFQTQSRALIWSARPKLPFVVPSLRVMRYV